MIKNVADIFQPYVLKELGKSEFFIGLNNLSPGHEKSSLPGER